MLKEFSDKAVEEFLNKDIDFKRIFTRSSNVFCTHYAIWVKKDPEQILIGHSVLQKIKKGVDYDNSL